MSDTPEGQATIAKPDELLALHAVTTEMFATLRRWFDWPARARVVSICRSPSPMIPRFR